ncbi:MAG: DUF302 domain-containing protein [Solirubrobacterales bacterium]|nr:DUF302 domain-containing protein [Solirubrobacterales bacterium]
MNHHDPLPAEIVTKTVAGSVGECVARLRATLEAKGLIVFAEFDHSGEARADGLELRDTRVVVFGNPRSGTPVMQEVPLAALDLPLKLLIYDDDGATTLAYLRPEALRERYGIPAALSAPLAGIDAIAEAAASA